MSDVVVDLVERDTVMCGRLVGRQDEKMTVADLKALIQKQRSLERKALDEYAAISSFWLSRPMPKFCNPGLRM